jgi:cytochrome bd ubiquinol oxidase subunit I
MDALDLARWQFGIVTVYHFLFVPLTIALSSLVAIMQTAWYRTGNVKYLKMTKFWGKLFLINFAMGVVTGLVQEFMFGMNWSDYSRFVGDVFGAPLAMEAILAFFLEATFLGVWIFGWERVPKPLHLASIWVVAFGTLMSAYFILAANSWMQHPVGFRINEELGRAELTSLWAVVTNSTTLAAFPHVITACFLTAAAFLIGVASWHLARKQYVDVMRSSLKLGFVTALISGVGVTFTGDIQAKIMTDQQPMKMAAAEAVYENTAPASFSIFTIGTLDGSEELFSVRIPRLLSYLAEGNFNAEVEGINDVQAAEQQRYGPGDYRPIVPVTYWSFRLMIGFGIVTAGLALLGMWLIRRGRLPESKWFWRATIWTLPFPLVANSFGWIFTEMGRQPWVVYGQLFTRDGVSPNVPAWHVGASLAAYMTAYLVLAIVEVGLLVRYIKAGPPPEEAPGTGGPPDEEARPLAFAY